VEDIGTHRILLPLIVTGIIISVLTLLLIISSGSTLESEVAVLISQCRLYKTGQMDLEEARFSSLFLPDYVTGKPVRHFTEQNTAYRLKFAAYRHNYVTNVTFGLARLRFMPADRRRREVE
jgi:hypothetical protein